MGILNNIIAEANAHQDEQEIDIILESVLETAMEATAKKRIINESTRKSLPDEAFGVIYTTKDGEKLRKYPLIVKNDYEATKELIARAIEYFHFCKPEWKKQLADNIIKAMIDNDIRIQIHPKNQINKFTTIPTKFTNADTNDKYQDKK